MLCGRLSAAGVRVDAGTVDARVNSRPQIPLFGLWQVVLAAVVAAGAPALTHWWETIRLRALRQGVRRSLQPTRSHADTLGIQAVRVQEMWKVFCAQSVSQQASWVVVCPWWCWRRHASGSRLWRRHTIQHDEYMERMNWSTFAKLPTIPDSFDTKAGHMQSKHNAVASKFDANCKITQVCSLLGINIFKCICCILRSWHFNICSWCTPIKN